MTLFEEIVAAFGGTQVKVADLPEDDPTAKIGKACENLFTGGVDVLRSNVPNDRIRALGRVVWDLVGHKQVLVAIGPDVPSLSFTVMQVSTTPKGCVSTSTSTSASINELHQAIVLIPKQWPQMVEDDPFMQLGAILFVGAQVVDFYNDRLFDDKGARRRWHAYEAELLRTLKTSLPRWKPNEYQCEVLANFPDGLDSKDVDLYPFKPYAPSQGDA